MRVLMISDFYPPYIGVVETVVCTLSRDLVRRGHEVTVATLAARDLPSHELDEGVRVHRIGMATQRIDRLFASVDRRWAPRLPDPVATSALRSIVASARPDVVHGHDWLARSFLPLRRRAVARGC